MKIACNQLTAELSGKLTHVEGFEGPQLMPEWSLPEGWPVPKDIMDLWTGIGIQNMCVCCPLDSIGEFVVNKINRAQEYRMKGIRLIIIERDTIKLSKEQLQEKI